jgi:hypothetical protein
LLDVHPAARAASVAPAAPVAAWLVDEPAALVPGILVGISPTRRVGSTRAVARGKDIKLQGASPGKQALVAGLCDEICVHLAQLLLGGGVRLFDALSEGIRLEKLSAHDGPHATHLRYRVLR